MENCLVTKLKGIVDNDNLLKFGELIIDVHEVENPSDESQWFNFIASLGKEINVSVIGDGYIIMGNSYASGTNVGKTVTIAGNGQIQNSAHPPFYYLSNGNYKVKITSKYDVDILTITEAVSLNLDDFKYSPISLVKYRKDTGTQVRGDISSMKDWTAPVLHITSDGSSVSREITGDISVFAGKNFITEIHLSNTLVTGNLASLQGLSSLVILRAWNTNIYGDIASLAGLTNLTTVDLSIVDVEREHTISGNIASLGTLVNLSNLYVFAGTQVTGSIESLVAAFRANGRTEGTINTNVYNNPNVTFNGQAIPTERHTEPLSWTVTTITCNGVTINA